MHQPAPATAGRRDRGPRALAECGSFATLAKRAGMLEALDRALRQTLPLPLRDHVRFADLRHGRLVFLAATPAWAARLRLSQSQILASARAIGVGASMVQVKVATADVKVPQPAPAKPLSPAVATHLRASAAACQDPELRAMYLTLAAVAVAAASTPGETP